MRKLLAVLTPLFLFCQPLHATIHYFENGRPDNTLPCTSGDPCDNYAGTTLDNANAMACGDRISLARNNDTTKSQWEAQEAEIEINTLGCDGNPIITESNGTGALPILWGAAVSTGFTQVGATEIWTKTGQTQTHLYSVVQTVSGTTKGLHECALNCTTSTLVRGSFQLSGSTLYVRLWAGENPNTSNVRIGSYTHFSGQGGRGLLRDTDTLARAHYHYFRDIKIYGANGVAFSFSGTGGRSANLDIIGAGADGHLCYHIEGFGGECANYGDYRSSVSYNALMGAGFGQGITSYGGPFGFYSGTTSFLNGMSNLDLLDFAVQTNVTEIVLLRNYLYQASQSPDPTSYDAHFYCDGCKKSFTYGLRVWGNGAVLANARSGIAYSTENAEVTQDNYLINSASWGTNWEALNTSHTAVKWLTMANLTLVSYNGSYSKVFSFAAHDSTTDNFILRNSIMVGDDNSLGVISDQVTAAAYLDANWNQYYRRGGNTGIYKIGSTTCTLAQWQAGSGTCGSSEDANSAYGDPLFVLDADGATADHHLQAGSPALNSGTATPYTVPAWLTQTVKDDIGPCGVRGTTLASGVLDDCATLDKGFHYDYGALTNTSVSLASSVQNTVTTLSVTFTTPKVIASLVYNDKVKITLPTGFVLSSGGTSAMTSSNISGTWSACTIDGTARTISCPRAGDGNTEFPELLTSMTVSVSNVRNPNATGTTGTFDLEILKSDGTKIYDKLGITGVSISSSGPAVCGNSIVESGETCDDGGTTGGDGCSAVCQTETPVCGNSLVEYLEQCDDGNTTALDGCSATCQIETPVCGNGVIESGETCDDSNTSSGDGCSSSCQTEAIGPHFSAAGNITISGNATIS